MLEKGPFDVFSFKEIVRLLILKIHHCGELRKKRLNIGVFDS